MAKQINKNFAYLVQNYKAGDKHGCILEGSSVDFIIYICTRFGSGFTINCYKETYNSFKTTLYDDFNKRLIAFGLDSPFERSKEVPTFSILGNKVNLIGEDGTSKAHGMSCDFAYYNEMLDLSYDFFDQTEMRCRKFWWGDYNPKVTSHWVYNKVIERPDVGFLHTTFRDNPFISETELNKILSYEDTEENRKAGTVDAYKWKVYGLGMRAAMEGLIFPEVTWIDDFPDDCEEEAWGLDFGYTIDPAALVRVGVKGPNNLYIKKYLYKPVSIPEDYVMLLDKIVGEKGIIWCGDDNPAMVNDIKGFGIPLYALKRFPGSIKYGNGLINGFKIHAVRDADFRKEQENYKRKEIGGIVLDEPIDGFNHIWEAARYAAMGSFRYYILNGKA